ncbi:MAG: hypothetical protein NC409_10110 [Clostridium sp.]|nr:hypothetical protein [Clostridium sp.]
MSGEAGGLILIPLALAAMPLILGGLAIAGAVTVGVKVGGAAIKYEEEQRRRREEIRRSGISQSIGDFRGAMKSSMNEQTSLNIQASERMMLELENQRNAMRRAAEQQDTQAFQAYVSQLKSSRAQTMQAIASTQDEFNVSYRQKIAESMGFVSQKINEQYAAYIDELRQLQTDMAAKDKKAQEIANAYIVEARNLLTALTEDFEGSKFSARQLTALNDQLNQAVSLYNNGRYESAIASAKDAAINTLEEIYETDVQKQEWENYFKLALVLSEEVKTYIESQAVITEEAKAYAEEASGKKLEDEIVGISVAEYTDRNAKGQTRFDYLLHKTNEIYAALREPQARQLSTDQLKSCAAFLNSELYPAIAMCINRAIINMNNAFSRQNISEEIIDFFEEHNFMFSGFAYDDDCHDKALHIGLENEATGEELIVTLAPELLENGDIQTHVDLKQIKGDEANEERKAYYRQCVETVVKGSNPYAKVNIKCKSETKNKLSADTETKKKLRK